MKNNLEKYRIPSVHTNAAYKIPYQGHYVFLKIYVPKEPRMSYEMRKFLDGMGVRQPVEYRSPEGRRNFEMDVLQRWRAGGYHVPAVLVNPFPEFSGFPVLTTEYIDGVTIRDFLQTAGTSISEQETQIELIFHDTAKRHRAALQSGDTLLFHIDANTRNILLAKGEIFHCDFEMGRPWESPVQCATREVLKMLVSLTEDAGPASVENICRIFKNVYQEQPVYACIEKGIAGRPFQAFHRYQDRKKKEKDPGRVTLYDILRCLA